MHRRLPICTARLLAEAPTLGGTDAGQLGAQAAGTAGAAMAGAVQPGPAPWWPERLRRGGGRREELLAPQRRLRRMPAGRRRRPRDDESFEDARRAYPGLGRAPRQIELPVEIPAYLLPDAELLKKSTPLAPGRANERDTAAVVLQALAQFGVEARVVGMVVGPRVTRYELQLAPGTKVAKVSALKDDLAYALATTEIRILAPIPGKSAVGVEVPNQRPDFVTLGDIYREFPKVGRPAHGLAGQGHLGQAGLHRPQQAAAPADRRHHRFGQERLRQLHRVVDPAAQHSGTGAPDHDRPEEGGALPLRPHPAPARAGGDEHEGRGRGAAQRGQGDGRPLRADGARALPQPGRHEQGQGPAGRAARCRTS